MDQEEFDLGIAEAIGKATAIVSTQAALIRLMLRKNLLTNEDVATLAGEAEMVLRSMEGLSAEASELAQRAVRGFASSWTKAVTKN